MDEVKCDMRPQVCPQCGSNDISSNNIHDDCCTIVVRSWCGACDACWHCKFLVSTFQLISDSVPILTYDVDIGYAPQYGRSNKQNWVGTVRLTCRLNKMREALDRVTLVRPGYIRQVNQWKVVPDEQNTA